MSETTPPKDHAGVVVPPPLIYLGFLALGLVLDYVWPVAGLPQTLQYVLGAVLIAAGLAVVILAWLRFRGAGTHIEPYKPTTAIITDGVYRFSRNPIYLALSGIYAGIGVALDNLWVLALLLPILLVIRFGVIAREERYLEDKFGEDYRRYRSTVRRWL